MPSTMTAKIIILVSIFSACPCDGQRSSKSNHQQKTKEDEGSKKGKTAIVDYCGITKDLQKALAIFEEDDIKGALEPAEKELEELKVRHHEAMSFFNDIEDKNNDDTIIQKFEPANVRDDFEYAFKMFSKALDVILPKKEADPYIPDFQYLSEKRQLIRTYYGGVKYSLREDGKKVQQLIDDHIRSLNISELMNPKEVTYENFLGYAAAKFKSERARTALIKNKARQIINELAPTNPAYYEKLRERLEQIIQQEEKRRKEDASYFNSRDLQASIRRRKTAKEAWIFYTI